METHRRLRHSLVVVQTLSYVCVFVTPWTAARQASLSFTSSQSLLKLMSIESVMPSNHFILCHPFLLLLSIFPSIRVFPNESALFIRRPEYWSFSFSISSSHEYSGWISFRIDCFDLLAVQRTLKSLLQHHSIKSDWSYRVTKSALEKPSGSLNNQKHQFFGTQPSYWLP